MGIRNERVRTIFIFTLLVFIGMAIGKMTDVDISFTGAMAGSDNCRLVEVPYEECTEIVVPYDYNRNYEEQVPFREKECKDREYSSDAYYLSNGIADKRWTNDGSGYMLTNLEKSKKIESRIYNYEKQPGLFTVEFRIWDEDYNLIDKMRKEYSVDPNSHADFVVSTDELVNKLGDDFRKGLLFSALLIRPEIEECETVTNYYLVNRQENIIEYRTEERCETLYENKRICD